MMRPRQTYHKQCPRCARQGRDRHEDNLAVYPDGHTYCFSCGYSTPATESVAEMADRVFKGNTHNLKLGTISLPSDVCKIYPEEAARWLIDCGLTPEDMLSPFIYYSPMWNRIIFPIFDSIDKLKGWQGRAIEDSQYPKWYTMKSFKPDEYQHIIGEELDDPDGIPVVVVEDMVSQLRVSKIYPCLCLFGIAMSETMAASLAQAYEHVVIWLDDGATGHALEHAEMFAKYGAKSYVIWTNADPKYHTEAEIRAKVEALVPPEKAQDRSEGDPCIDPPSDPPRALLDAHSVSKEPNWADLQDDLGDVMC